MTEARTPLLEVDQVHKHFPVGRPGLFGGSPRVVRAVEGVSFTMAAGETVALVGESGSGKSTLGRVALGLISATQGRVRWKGQDIAGRSGDALRRLRCEMQIIFQDSLSSLNPRQTIRQILSGPLLLHGRATADVTSQVCDLLATVGLTPPALYLDRYPHEFSGGQRQRIGIARAISLRPELVVADEPVSSLDVSIQAQILTLLKRLQAEMGLSYLFITHDLSVARSLAQRVMVLYLGQVVEEGPVAEVFARPLHPYSQALLAATPVPDPRRARQRERLILSGEMPSPTNPPPGCRFHTRCPLAQDVCREVAPQLLGAGMGQRVACHLVAPVVGAAG